MNRPPIMSATPAKGMTSKPHIAIIDPNTLAIIGLRQILQQVMPIMEVDAYGSFEEFELSDTDRYFHYFVAVNIVLAHRVFFLDRCHKTIVLTVANDSNVQLTGFHSLCVHVSEEQLVKSILMLEQRAHAHGRNLPEMPRVQQANPLTSREVEVLVLIVRGYINKEIADRLNIGLTTVISHRKNIMEKLGLKSVSALTIYAVMNGYVDVDKI